MPPPASAREYSVSGRVVDNTYTPLSDVRVEVVDGPRSGLVAATDDDGKYAFPGVFPDVITVRASKAGYTASLRTLPQQQPWLEHVDVSFFLDTPSIDISGDYTVTIMADASCSGIPEAARTRTYAATIDRSRFAANTYQIVLSGATFYPMRNRMFAAVARDVAFVDIDPYDTSVTEQLTPSATLNFWGAAKATIIEARFSGRFEGQLQYCDRALGPLGSFPYVGCAVPPITCESANHGLIMTRR